MNAYCITTAFKKITKDDRINLSHISLYIGLLVHWQESEFQNPISVSRKQLMSIGRIKSKATYHKCIRELHEFGYIKYEPTYNPYTASSITILMPQGEMLRNNPAVKKEFFIRLSIEVERV